MVHIKLPSVLFGTALLFGVYASATSSWQAACMALLGTAAATVEMFMRRSVFEARLLDLAGDLRNTAKELNEELTRVKNDIIRLNNKNGLR